MIVNENFSSVLIVGAGLTGLVCGKKLIEAGYKVKILEQQTSAGGMVKSMRLGQEYIETIPHHIQKQHKSLLHLLQEMKLADNLEWFDSLSFGKAGKKKIGYLNGGFHSLISALVQDIIDGGGIIHYGYTAMDIASPSPNKYQLTCILEDCSTMIMDGDYLLFTGSCRNFSHVSSDLPLPRDYRDAVMDITYQANICLLLLTKTAFSGCFSRNISVAGPFQKIVEQTNLLTEKKYGGHVLYLYGNTASSSEIWTKSDAEVFNEFFKQLQVINPNLRPLDIIQWRLTRIRYALPLHGAPQTLLNPLPNLFLASLALARPSLKKTDQYSMNACVELAFHTTDLILSHKQLHSI